MAILALLLTEADVRTLLPMSQALDLVEEGFHFLGTGQASTQPRRRIRLDGGLFHCMEAAVSPLKVAGLKAYTSTRAGVTFAVLLFSTEDSQLLAIIEADWLGRIRTGAATGVATRMLASPEAQVGAVIGAGEQAETQIEAMALAKTFEVIKVFSRSSEKRNAFVQRMSKKVACRLESVSSVEQAVRESDVVTTITTASEPVLNAEWLQQGSHVNAAGSNRADRRELDERTVGRASLVVVDSIGQAKTESADLIEAVRVDSLSWDEVQELGDIVAGKTRGRASPDDITLFESQGLALEDVMVAQYVYREALRQGRGQQVPFGLHR